MSKSNAVGLLQKVEWRDVFLAVEDVCHVLIDCIYVHIR